MAVLSSQNKSLPTQAKLLKKFSSDYPALHFKAGTDFAWSPKSHTITYIKDTTREPINTYALIHEVAHADLEHNTFSDDFSLLRLEVAAWERAKQISQSVSVEIDEEHVQDCLDTYRDWLHARAQCPTCGVVSLQAKDGSYTCFNCKTGWKVPKSQLCRVRRTRI
jgi:hypothetical protein